MPAVIIPWLGGCPHRTRALEWVRKHYPWPVRVAHGLQPWVKAEAVNPAVRASRAEVIVIADADVWCAGLPEAVEAVKDGAPWAIPHRQVRRLSRETTARLIETDTIGDDLIQRPYTGVLGGGYVVARRETLLEIPLDPRFVGWGQEDVSHGLALLTLAGAPWRGRADLIHLYHPPQDRMTRKYGTPAGRALYRRYLKAKHDPEAMRALIREFDQDVF